MTKRRPLKRRPGPTATAIPSTKLSDALRAIAEITSCNHKFTFVKDTIGDGVIGLCDRCGARVTAWPGGVHFDEIAAARPASGNLSSL